MRTHTTHTHTHTHTKKKRRPSRATTIGGTRVLASLASLASKKQTPDAANARRRQRARHGPCLRYTPTSASPSTPLLGGVRWCSRDRGTRVVKCSRREWCGVTRNSCATSTKRGDGAPGGHGCVSRREEEAHRRQHLRAVDVVVPLGRLARLLRVGRGEVDVVEQRLVRRLLHQVEAEQRVRGARGRRVVVARQRAAHDVREAVLHAEGAPPEQRAREAAARLAARRQLRAQRLDARRHRPPVLRRSQRSARRTLRLTSTKSRLNRKRPRQSALGAGRRRRKQLGSTSMTLTAKALAVRPRVLG